MKMVTRCFFLVFTLVFLAAPRMAPAQQPWESFEPESVEEISPCCTPEEITEGMIPSEKPPRMLRHGSFFDPETMERLKKEARTNPRVTQLKMDDMWAMSPKSPYAPILSFKFIGITFTGFFPPDTILAVGPGHLLEATNGMVRLSSKTNSNVVTIALNQFFKRGGKFVFDPKAYFDPMSQRFFVVALERGTSPKASAILMAVSQSANPGSLTAGWCFYRINGKSANSWADFPSLGMNQQWLAVNVNNFDFDTNRYFKAFIKVIAIKTLINNSANCPKIKVFSIPRPEFNITPAQHYTNGSADLLAINHFGPSTFYGVWRITGTTKPKLINRVLVNSTNAYAIPPDADQPNSPTKLDTGDNRILHLSYRDGKLYGVHGTACNFGGLPNESCVRLIEFNPDVPSVTFESDLGAGPNKFLWHPSIAVNKKGDVTLAAQHSGRNVPVSTVVTGKRSSAPKLEPMKMVMRGKCPLTDFEPGTNYSRSGDFTGAALDPSDEITVWIAGELSQKTSQGCKWATAVGRTKYN